MKTKKVTISLTAEQQQQAKEISKELLSNQNISGFLLTGLIITALNIETKEIFKFRFYQASGDYIKKEPQTQILVKQ